MRSSGGCWQSGPPTLALFTHHGLSLARTSVSSSLWVNTDLICCNYQSQEPETNPKLFDTG